MNKSESKYFHTAERMDEALLSLLLEKDFEYITVKDICACAGVNRSTFYLQCESRVEQELGKSGSNAAKDMTKQARQGADQGGGLDVR